MIEKWGHCTIWKYLKGVNYSVLALQNEGFGLSSKYSIEGRLHAQSGIEGYTLFSSLKPFTR